MAFRICAIGCGGMATMGHGPAFQKYAKQHPDTCLAACCDLSAERAAAYAARFGFERTYTDMNEMLRKEKPDAVSLVVPVGLTERLSIYLLEQGIPVILEKPPGLNREETLRMMEAAQKTGTPHQVAFNRRHMPLVRMLRDWRTEENVPALHSVQYDFTRVGRTDADFSTTAIHGIDTVRFLAGDYRRVDFIYRAIPGAPDHVANIFMECELAGGVSASVRFYPMSGAVTERAALHALDETYFMRLPIWGGADVPGSLALYRQDTAVRMVSGTPVGEKDGEPFVANGFYGENKAFFDAVRMGLRPEDDIASGLQTVEIADCIRRRIGVYQG